MAVIGLSSGSDLYTCWSILITFTLSNIGAEFHTKITTEMHNIKILFLNHLILLSVKRSFITSIRSVIRDLNLETPRIKGLICTHITQIKTKPMVSPKKFQKSVNSILQNSLVHNTVATQDYFSDNQTIEAHSSLIFVINITKAFIILTLVFIQYTIVILLIHKLVGLYYILYKL